MAARLKSKITVIYATSPHRFGRSTGMIDFSINSLKSFGLSSCNFIICADGVNPNSKFAEENQTLEYKAYLDQLKIKYGEDNVICADRHLGLTENYLQAFKSKKIKTPFSFLMNHDVAAMPSISEIDFSSIIKSIPDFVKILIFPRDSIDSNHGGKWWRATDLETHPFFHKFKSPWKENAKIAFGNQDHGCIVRTKDFLKFTQDFYEPTKTFFLEDSVQEYLNTLDQKDLSGWEKYGGCVWKGSYTFHLDGQSKAGIEFRQENGRGGEQVWSKAEIRTARLREICKHENASEELKECLLELLKIEKQFHTVEIWEKFKDFAIQIFHFHDLQNLNLSLTSSESNQNLENPFFIKNAKPLPVENERYSAWIKLNQTETSFYWKPPSNQNYILKLTTPSKQICWGGHKPNETEVDHKKHNISREEKFYFELFDYSVPEHEKKPSLEKEEIDPSLVHYDSHGNIYIKWENENGLEHKLNLFDSSGNQCISNGEEKQIHSILRSNHQNSEWFRGFFEIYQDGEPKGRSWEFQVSFGEFSEGSSCTAEIFRLLKSQIVSSFEIAEPDYNLEGLITWCEHKEDD